MKRIDKQPGIIYTLLGGRDYGFIIDLSLGQYVRRSYGSRRNIAYTDR